MLPASLLAALLLVPLAAPRRHARETLAFKDEFNDLNETQWKHAVDAWGGGNGEFQFYRNHRNNSYVKNGKLFIKPTLTIDDISGINLQNGNLSFPGCTKPGDCFSKGGTDIVTPVLSARVSSTFSFKYGRLEVCAKLPKGDWLWPAIWLLPVNDTYGGWPCSGEIDLMEARGNQELKNSAGGEEGINKFSSALHYGTAYNAMKTTHFQKVFHNNTLADNFHVFELVWSETGLRFLINKTLVGEVKDPKGSFWKAGNFSGTDIWSGKQMAPFDQQFQIILNVAVGGRYFEGMARDYTPPWSLTSGYPKSQFWDARDDWLKTWEGENTALQVDYVRVYHNSGANMMISTVLLYAIGLWMVVWISCVS